MSISIGGFVGGSNGEIDWILRTGVGDSTEWILDTPRQAGAHVMGGGTYYDMAAFWPCSDTPFAAPLNDIPKVVFSRQGIKDGTDVDRTMRALADP
jgi:dihydrofolate reductase